MEVLDFGYVELVEHWGSDERIIEAARMSTGKGFQGWGPFYVCTECERPWIRGQRCECGGADNKEKGGDEKLLAYLWKNKHTTPFEMCGFSIEVKAPIFVYRQWHRHRTQSYNEMSARYVPLPDEDYLPTVERLLLDGGKNKQARGASDVVLDEAKAEAFIDALRYMYRSQQMLYEQALEYGVSKEIARIHLPVARYSVMRASANLLNWLKFLKLRLDSHAQYEIRMYAESVGLIVEKCYPRTWSLFIREAA